MLAYRYPLIAREGWLWIAFAAAIALLLQWQLGWLVAPLWLAVGLLLMGACCPSIPRGTPTWNGRPYALRYKCV